MAQINTQYLAIMQRTVLIYLLVGMRKLQVANLFAKRLHAEKSAISGKASFLFTKEEETAKCKHHQEWAQ